jgi:hypothetical protein
VNHFCLDHNALDLGCGRRDQRDPAAAVMDDLVANTLRTADVGTFDDPTVAKAGREIFRDDALPWVAVHGEIPRFAKRPG